MKTIQMTIDVSLLKAMDRLTKQRKTSRSAFIRSAVEAELHRESMRQLEARHVAGYQRQPVSAHEFDVWLNEQDWGAR